MLSKIIKVKLLTYCIGSIKVFTLLPQSMVSFFRGTYTEFATVSNKTWCNSLSRPESSAVVGHIGSFPVTGTLVRLCCIRNEIVVQVWRTEAIAWGLLTFLFQSSLFRTFVLWETVIIKELNCIRSKVFADLIWGLAVTPTNPLSQTLRE